MSHAATPTHSKTSLIFGGALLFCLAIILMARHAHHQFEEVLVEQTEQQLLLIAKSTATSLKQHMEDHLNSLSELAHDQLFKKRDLVIPATGPERNRLRSFYEAHRRELESIAIIDAGGRVLASWPEEMQLAGDFDMAGLAMKLAPQVSPHFLDDGGRRVVTLSVPIAIDHELTGVVRALVSIDTLTSLYIQPLRFEGGPTPVLIDESGHFLSRPPVKKSGEVAAPSSCVKDKCDNRQRITAELAAGREGVGIFIADQFGERPEPRFIAYAPIKFNTNNWGIGVVLPFSAISGPIRQHSRQALIMVAALLLFLGFGATLLLQSHKKKQAVEIESRYLQQLAEKATELERANRILRDQAIKDELTGLYNYRYFHKVLQRDFALATRGKGDYSCMIIDLDHFKTVNDNHGHAFGDLVLKGVGNILLEESRDTDVVARYGGEEFVILLPNTDLEGSMIIAERIRTRLEAHGHTDGRQQKQVTASIGVSSYRAHAPQSPQDLLAYADKALYQAKSLQRNQVVVYS
ncbi:MAG: diguanylate cyclase [Desulfobulbaceae bacterium]|nr:diguanylate cyclase [Desulfobulbaceae bacterium]